MILRIYAIRDIKAAAFAPPFFMQRDEMAIRAFSDAIKDPNHQMSRHAEDYELFHLGEFDDESGKVEPVVGPRFLANGLGEVGAQ